MRDIANQKAHLSQVLLAFYVGITTKPTPVWSTGLLRVFQDLNLLNPSLLIPTWFPVEWSWLVLAQTLYMELEAPPVPRTPLCCIFPGPRGPTITEPTIISRRAEYQQRWIGVSSSSSPPHSFYHHHHHSSPPPATFAAPPGPTPSPPAPAPVRPVHPLNAPMERFAMRGLRVLHW